MRIKSVKHLIEMWLFFSFFTPLFICRYFY